MTKANAEIITVRVTDARPYDWYVNFIGDTYQVFRHGDYYYILGYGGMLLVEHCEVV